MSLQLFGLLFSGLLFSSYTWKVLTALSADEADETPSKISYAWPRRRSDNPPCRLMAIDQWSKRQILHSAISTRGRVT